MITPVQFSSREEEIIRMIIGTMITNNTFTTSKSLWERLYNGE